MSAGIAVPGIAPLAGPHTVLCGPCARRGHRGCYASHLVDGEPQCIYCVDSEPCLADSPPRKVSSAPAGPKALALELKRAGLADGDIVSALVNQGYKARQAKQAIAELNPPPKEKVMQTETSVPGKSNGHAPAARHCAGYKKACGAPLGKQNRTGLCKKCTDRKLYHERYSPKAKGNARHKARVKRVKTNAELHVEPAPPGPQLYQLEVTEAQLDRYLSQLELAAKDLLTLPADLKLLLVNHFLAQNPAPPAGGAA